ncbi:CMD domain protein [Microterricola viridarii]|uniref:CMD domain protein, Avi_7170 family n=1 Tax=Microterricola viridarii TaxID=412690 RepID=A0A1H1YAD9_9MICO|nr:CMD domain protein [Microterricola viridarii]SDT18361.1 CMD domain protein, Avi_7170 family [Microterricola viridarii]
MTTITPPDVIDELLGVTPGSAIDELRARRPVTRANAQASYDALFTPEHPGTVSAVERLAVAAFVAGLHASAPTERYYAEQLLSAAAAPVADESARALPQAVATEIAAARTSGPYGAYPAGPLSVEDSEGLRYRVAPERRDVLGVRLSAALDHAHLLVFRPREASPAALQALLDAGWSTSDIVTLSQLVAFLTFQIRVVAGLELLS